MSWFANLLLQEAVLSSSEDDDLQEQSCSLITITSDESGKDDDDELLHDPYNTQSSSTSLFDSSTSASKSVRIAEEQLNFSDFSKLQAGFGEKLSSNQILVAYKASGSDIYWKGQHDNQ